MIMACGNEVVFGKGCASGHANAALQCIRYITMRQNSCNNSFETISALMQHLLTLDQCQSGERLDASSIIASTNWVAGGLGLSGEQCNCARPTAEPPLFSLSQINIPDTGDGEVLSDTT